MKRVSVIMPVCNVEKFIAKAINSAINQTEKNIEIIIVDNDSEDNTKCIIRKFMRKDKRIKLIENEKNLYRSTALNQGIKTASGKYICFLDGDDVYRRNKLKFQADYLDKHPEVDMIYGKARLFGEEQRNTTVLNLSELNLKKLMKERAKLSKKYLKTLSVGQFLGLRGSIPSCSPMIRKRVFRKVRFDVKLKRTQDYDLWFQIIGRGFTLKPMDKLTYYYRVHGSQSVKNFREVNRAKNRILNKFLSGAYFR